MGSDLKVHLGAWKYTFCVIVNFGKVFVYVYCTSEMFTALGVLIDVNISNKYKRWIIINKKMKTLLYGIFLPLYTILFNCLQQQHGKFPSLISINIWDRFWWNFMDPWSVIVTLGNLKCQFTLVNLVRVKIIVNRTFQSVKGGGTCNYVSSLLKEGRLATTSPVC